MWAEIGGKTFYAQQACVDKIRHAVGEVEQLLPDMLHLGPAFIEVYNDCKACYTVCNVIVDLSRSSTCLKCKGADSMPQVGTLDVAHQ